MLKLLTFFIILFTVNAYSASKPNVVLILVDDLGWTDLGCYGSKYYETPNIDRLASQGMKFSNGYAAAAICSPTRAAVMTGRYPVRIGITDWIRAQFQGGKIPADKKNPGGFKLDKKHNLNVAVNPLWMEHDEVTIAEILKPQGYTNCFIGKWHLGAKDWFPETQGFDYNFGGCDLGQPPSYFDPYKPKVNKKRKNNDLYIIPNLEPRKAGEYLTDREAYEARKFIQENKDKQFFMYLCNYAVHTPIQAQEHLIKKYEAKPKTNQKDAKYAAMVEAVDNAIGTIMKTLNEEGLTENTLFIFTGDNGGLLGPTHNAPLRSGKGYPYEGGIREPFIVRWPAKIKAGQVSDVPVSSVDILPTIAAATGSELPKKEIDGVNVLPVLDGSGVLEERALMWHFPHFRGRDIYPYSIIRDKGWKMIRYYAGPVKYELFYLNEDIGETKNLASSNPEKITMLNKKLDSLLKESEALVPYPGN